MRPTDDPAAAAAEPGAPSASAGSAPGSEPRPPARRAIATLGVLAVLGVAIAGVAVGWREPGTATAVGPVAAAEGEAGTLALRVAELERRLGIAPAGTNGTGDLGRRLDGLEARMARLDAAVASFDGRVSGLRGDARSADRIAIAALNVSSAAQTARPFARELDLLRRAAAGQSQFEPGLASLLPYAQRGVPTLLDLKEGFRAVGPMLIHREKAEASTWSQRLHDGMVWILVWFDFADPPAPGTAELAVARTEGLLAAGQLAAAVGELSSLSPALLSVASGWLTLARMRLSVEQAISDITGQALALSLGPG